MFLITLECWGYYWKSFEACLAQTMEEAQAVANEWLAESRQESTKAVAKAHDDRHPEQAGWSSDVEIKPIQFGEIVSVGYYTE